MRSRWAAGIAAAAGVVLVGAVVIGTGVAPGGEGDDHDLDPSGDIDHHDKGAATGADRGAGVGDDRPGTADQRAADADDLVLLEHRRTRAALRGVARGDRSRLQRLRARRRPAGVARVECRGDAGVLVVLGRRAAVTASPRSRRRR
jgi:hypothetical protein